MSVVTGNNSLLHKIKDPMSKLIGSGSAQSPKRLALL